VLGVHIPSLLQTSCLAHTVCIYDAVQVLPRDDVTDDDEVTIGSPESCWGIKHSKVLTVNVEHLHRLMHDNKHYGIKRAHGVFHRIISENL
jgi:hypothetical protein